jgi:hypothetical protein
MKPIDILPSDSPETKSVESKLNKLMESGKKVKVAGVFDALPLPDVVEQHFRSDVMYVWSAEPKYNNVVPEFDGKYFGIWLNDNLEYVHTVYATQEVLEHVLRIKIL